MNIYARVSPKSIKLTETYHYHKDISSNESLDQKEAPQGKIEFTIPYDGQKYFNQKAIQDIIGQINKSSSKDQVNVLIGHLAISNYEKTDLGDWLSQNDKYQYSSVPISIPVLNNTLMEISQLSEDKHLCLLEHSYVPKQPEIVPIYTEVQVLDDYFFYGFLSTTNSFQKSDREVWNDVIKPNNTYINMFADFITDNVKSGFKENVIKGKIFLQIQVRLALDIEINSPPSPQLKRVSIEWPTLTSSQSFALRIIEPSHSSGSPSPDIVYNPLNKSLECIMSDVNLEKTSDSGITKRTHYKTSMMLGILYPGELYQQTTLKGEIEAEIPEILLSELQTRFYGFKHDKSDFIYSSDSGKDILESKTRLLISFNLDINEAFKKRIRSTAQELIFDSVLPTEKNLSIIDGVLIAQGFSSDFIYLPQSQKKTDSQTNIINTKWLIYAEHPEGIDTMTLWIAILGEENTTEVETREGRKTFKRLETTGKLTMYLLGKLPRHSHILMKRMNALQSELRKQLSKVQQGPAISM